MNGKLITKEKFILQLTGLLILSGLLFGSFVMVDRYHERYIKLKLAELGFEYKKEINHERR